MKYIVVLGDGMADYPCKEFDRKTPLEMAKNPNMDFIASKGICGLAKTIPIGMPPGSDTANLSVMGYDPKIYYTGRSPLEAVSIGIDMDLHDVAYRCNTITLSEEENFEDCTMVDYSCDEIPTEESAAIIRDMDKHFGTESMHLYPGFSYRHCLILNHAETGADTTPPHDISTKKIRDYLPKGTNGELLCKMMKESYDLLKDHPINLSRKKRGLNPVSAMWFWGEGRKPALSSFSQKYGLHGSVVSAVDLIKGIAICAGMDSIDVEGATGNIDTNFDGKAQAAINALRNGSDFVYIHLEAPDECGHRYEPENKIRSIELIDEKIIAPVMQAMREDGEDFSIMVLPDHPTPLSTRTHASDPVPFALYRSYDEKQNTVSSYSEKTAESTGYFVDHGHNLLDLLIRGKID